MSLSLPSGLALRQTLAGGTSPVRHPTFSPDGQHLAATGTDGAIHIWNLATGALTHSLQTDSPAYIPAWAPDSRRLAATLNREAIGLWELTEQQPRRTLPNATAIDLAWLPGGRRLITAHGPALRLLDPDTGEVSRGYAPHPAAICTLTVCPDGRWLATGSTDGTVRVLSAFNRPRDSKLPGPRWELPGHSAPVHQVVWSPDGWLLASVSLDGTIRLWDPHAGALRATPLLPTAPVLAVSFSHDGRLLAGTTLGGDLHLWRTDTGRLLRTINTGERIAEAVFHPHEPTLALAAGEQIHLLSVPRDMLLGTWDSALRSLKVVFAGDQGVGKTALIQALERHPYSETFPTGGRAIWLHDFLRRDRSDGRLEEDQILFCELGDQHGLSAVDQLYLHHADVAVVVFDARSGTDPYESPRHWARILQRAEQARNGRPVQKFLVLARTKLATLNEAELRETARQLGYRGAFRIDAEDAVNVGDLRQTLLGVLNWDGALRVESLESYYAVQSLILQQRRNGVLLANRDELYGALGGAGGEVDRQFFDSCLVMAESRGLIYYLQSCNRYLLRPDLLDEYAAALVRAAQGQGDLACLPESATTCDCVNVEDEVLLAHEAADTILQAAAAELVARGAAHRITLGPEPHLVFFGEAVRRLPPLGETTDPSVMYRSGEPLRDPFVTLLVRLSHTPGLTADKLGRDGARFRKADGTFLCTVLSRATGELALTFSPSVSPSERQRVTDAVEEHLLACLPASRVEVWRAPCCEKCGGEIPPQQVRRRLERGQRTIMCNVCETEEPVSLESPWLPLPPATAPAAGGVA